MEFISQHLTTQLLQTYGYFAIFFLILGESMGLPLPGETVLLAASVYAGKTHHLSIYWVVFSAAFGAVIGDNIGYAIGYFGGYKLLRRFGKYVKIDEGKIKLGRYLFLLYGGRIVFFGRFVAILRILSALLAGVNRMHWKRFLLFNTLGGITWATLVSTLAYILGRQAHQLSLNASIATFTIATLFLIAYSIYLHRHMNKLEKKAEKMFPGHIE